MADFKDLMDTTPDTNYEKDLSLSQRLEKAKNSVEWQENPLFNTADAMKASRNPINRIYGTQDLHKLTSDAGTIAWDTFRKGVIDLASLPDKVEMAIGNTLAGVSGNTLGTEIRDRAYDNLMKTMEDSRFIDSNYGDAETWTARFTGGAMSMGEMLAIGALSGGVGLGAFVGTTSLSDGALNDMANYYEEHGNLDGYETDPLNLALDYGNAVFQIASEMALGTGRLLNGKVLKHGSTTAAIAKETVNNFIQESVQGLAADATEVLKSNEDVDILLENFGGYVKDGIVGGVLGGVTGGTFYRVNKNRGKSTIKEVGKKLYPEKNEKELDDFAEEVWAKTEEKELKSFAPEIIAHTEAVNDKGKIRDNIRQKVELMYKDADMSEKQRAKTVEATTTVELENMLYDSIERRIPLTSHPLLQGEVNELGWFRTGIPENRRAEIDALNKELVDLKAQQKELMSAQEKDYTKLEDIETKIEQFRKDLPAKLGELVVADRQQIQDMLAEQRRLMAERKAIRSVRERARKAIAKQDQQEQADKDKLAEQIAKGAEKAKEQRVKAETKKQTQEAKARTLTEQRQIQSSIKNIKVKVNNTKTAKNLELKYAIDQATDDSLRTVLKKRELNEYTVKHMTRRQLKAAVRELTDVSVAELVPMSAREISREQALQEKKVEKKTTAKSFFHRQINRKFANDSGILQAWGYSKDDSAINLVFVKDGGYADWNEIVMALQDSGYLPQSAEDTYEQTDALVDKAKDIVLNNKELGVSESDMTVEEMDYTSVVGYDWLIEAGYTPEQINAMTDEEMATKLKEIFAQTQPVEPEYTEEQMAEWDTVQYQDLADENARLDEVNPEYTGETIEVNGVERTVYNSNGERIAKSAEALTNFWNWFGDSKVVDKDGRPLVVYHGTGAEFDTFLQEKIKNTSEGYGFYFIDSQSASEGFGKNVVAAYLKIENPVYAYNQIFLAEDYDGDLDIMEANDEMVREAVQQVKAELESKGYDFYPQVQADLLDNFSGSSQTQEVLDGLLDMSMYIENEDFDREQFLNDVREAEIKAFGIDGYRTKGYAGGLGTVYVPFMSNQIKSTDNKGTFSPDTGNIYKQPQMQTKTTGKGKDTFRGAFIPEYRFIATTSNLDASTLNHELAHDWGQENFRWARSGKASESFLRSWGAVEKAIGITEKDTYFTYDASEKFARAYEGWLLQRSDWAELLHIDTEEDKQAVNEAMEDYRKELVDIYDSLNNEYFKMTWGKTGELKPELKEWFERSTKYDELDNKVARGEITEEQASEEKLGEMLESATNATVENMSVKDKHTTDVLETLETMKEQERQFEVEGGNANSLQRRLDKIALAQNITANNAVLGKYDTHRDMLAVAEAADNFVNTRLNDALAIINGKMPEQDGLYASDLYTALERKAKAENDFELIEELRNSLVANQLAKELGQRVAGFRNYTGNGDVDIMSTLKSLDKLYDKAYNEKERQQLEDDIKDYFESVKMADSQQDLDGFFNDLECK